MTQRTQASVRPEVDMPQTPPPGASAETTPGEAASWRVVGASHEDLAGVVAAVADLLVELGGTPPPVAAMEATARVLIEDPQAGALLLAKADGTIVGVLGASWQIAIHSPGKYALIQDLWVHPSWRKQAIGRDLLAALVELAQVHQMARIEVGLPSPRFPRLAATEAFYRNNDFSPVGLRMRRLCS
jgi:GNAT superfamily N-acetyltransferase